MRLDPNIALHTGLVLGTLLKHGVEAEPVLDRNGDYTEEITIPTFVFNNDEGERRTLRVRIQIVGAVAVAD